MSHSALRCVFRCGVILATLLAGSAHAQSTPGRPERADPLNPQARVPATSYQSPLARYRRLGEDERVSWKEANEAVNRIGGWRAYARQAQQPEPAAAPASAPISPPTNPPAKAPSHSGPHRH